MFRESEFDRELGVIRASAPRGQRTVIVCGAGYVSGKEIIALELARGMMERGCSIQVVTSFWNNGDFPKRLREASIPARVLPIGFISATLTRDCLRMNAEQLLRGPELWWGYAKLLRSQRPARIIHTNLHHILLLLPFLEPQRDLFWVHELMPNLPQYRRVFGWLERRMGAFVCVSHAAADSLRRIGVREEKILVIHNGLSDPSGPEKRRCAADERFRIGIAGQVGPWKGHDDLVEAFAVVRLQHPEAELHIFGTGQPGYTDKLKSRCRELGMEDDVRWHGFVPNRAEIYSGIDIGVMASREPEPFGLTAVEAGFFGLPVVATRRGGLPEIVKHEVNGLLVEAQRPDEIARAISRLIEDPQLRGELSENAQKIAVSDFGRERFIDEFLAVVNGGILN